MDRRRPSAGSARLRRAGQLATESVIHADLHEVIGVPPARSATSNRCDNRLTFGLPPAGHPAARHPWPGRDAEIQRAVLSWWAPPT